MPSRLVAAQRRLDAARERRRRAALGPPLSQDEQDLDVLATVGPSDLALAEALIRDAAGRVGADLFGATPEGPDRRPPGRI
jgi:hypothetical protein